MTRCTATITTVTMEWCDHRSRTLSTTGMDQVREVCTGVGHHFTFHTLTCDRDFDAEWPRHSGVKHRSCDGHDRGEVMWQDDTPGAMPHTPPLVTEAEVQAAWREITGSESVPPTRTDVSRALRAAAETRGTT